MQSREAVVIRPRRPEDVTALVEVMGRQQPVSRYPLVWPLPEPAADFIARGTERAAWVAEVDGVVVGHVSSTIVPDDEIHSVWSRSTGRPNSELGCVSSLFVDLDVIGKGVGGRLLDTAVAEIRGGGRTPVLDVTTQTQNPASSVYEHRGWQLAGHARPLWLPPDEPDVRFYVLPDSMGRQVLSGTVVPGHGVASGAAADSPHPAGTISLQLPHFAARGVDLSGLRPATINLDVGARVTIDRPTLTLTDVAWTDHHDAETFSFVRCFVKWAATTLFGYVYYPHPETKPAHFQADSVLELLMPDLPGLAYGNELSIEVPSGSISFH